MSRDAVAPGLLEAAQIILLVADAADDTGHRESEVIEAEWDVLGPLLRAAVRKAQGEEE